MDLINSVMSMKAEAFSQRMDIAVTKANMEMDQMLVDMITEVVQSSKASVSGSGRGQVVDVTI